MAEQLQTLSNLFNSSIFRIPDYQRGYAWQLQQLDDFWSDLINLDLDREHYTGVITLKQIPKQSIPENSSERWLVERGNHVYHVIDGQQRLTTCVILLQCFLETARQLPENTGLQDNEIVFCDDRLDELISTYLWKKNANSTLTTYKFGYETDNPSYLFFRHRILDEPNSGTIAETFYTLNLQNAKTYFLKQLQEVVKEKGPKGLEGIFKRLTTQFLFNPYTIQQSFDEFVAFETMNNRGKRLSNLELLKNRLIYLSTLYEDREADAAVKKQIRDNINDAWREVYHQLGRNKNHPLNDDDFLRAHWIMYFMYSRRKGDDYVKFLLSDKFTAKKVLQKKAVAVSLEEVEEVIEQTTQEDDEDIEESIELVRFQPHLAPKEIQDYVLSLKAASKAWYDSFFPLNNSDIPDDLAAWLDKLNRLPIFYCRPFVMALLLRADFSTSERLEIVKALERFLFINFRLVRNKSNNGSSEFFNASRELYSGRLTKVGALSLINKLTNKNFENGVFKYSEFQTLTRDLFLKGKKQGFYAWSGLMYFLYEYELHLMANRGTPKIDWKLFVRSEKDKVSIEHICPQNRSKAYWAQRWQDPVANAWGNVTCHSLGNLLPLSRSINSSLQNDGFDEKKEVKKDQKGNTLRNGYKNGSYSEIEVSEIDEWTPNQIKTRGLKLLNWLEGRWKISLGTEAEKVHLLQLTILEGAPAQATN